MNLVERLVRRIDRGQQRWSATAFVFGLIRKYGDDRGGALAALLTFYGFLSLFPLLLLLITVLGLLGPSGHSFAERVEHAAFSEFPIVGTKLSRNIHGLHDHSTLGLVVGILGVLWGSQGALQTAQYAQSEVWNIPNVQRPGFLPRLGRTAATTVLLGAFLLATTILAGIVTVGHHGGWVVVGAGVVSLFANVGLFAVAFRLLTPKVIQWSDMLAGSVVGGVAWTLLQYAGGALVSHQLRNTSKVYGNFALVLGLLAFLYLSAEVILYASELNVVRARHLWPRSMVQPPLTTADKSVLSMLVLESKRRPEQQVSTGFLPHGDLTSTDP
ncbi:MAG TPA: YihY/virulence factor BrkB family protein [Acidimicrobiales bacterium]|nr:YihY/virulence factor BrkB family protein [Acidimicrobiales bacterium]